MIVGNTLEYGIDNPLLLLASTPRCQITWDWLVHLDHGSLITDNVEFMLVCKFVVSGAESRRQDFEVKHRLLHQGKGYGSLMVKAGLQLVSFRRPLDT